MDTELKQCLKCKEYKERDLFSKDKANKDGKQSFCKSCSAAAKRAHYKANPEKEAARICAYRKANKEKIMLSKARHRAKNNNLEFNLSLEDIQIPERCPILGILLERGNTQASRDSSPSLDKIHNEKGYVKGNVHVVSNRFNLLKKDATFAELILMGKWAESFTETA